jgi:hypothetical protein
MWVTWPRDHEVCIIEVRIIFVGWGFPFPIMLVPRYKLSLCHTLIKSDLIGFSGIWYLCVWVVWPRDHEVYIIWYQSLAPLIRLYPSEIFVSCWFRKNSLMSNFFFSLNLRHIKKFVILFCYCPKYIGSIKKIREKRKGKKKQIVQKDVYWFMPQKTKQGKIKSNQFRISSNLIVCLLGS